MIAGFSYCYLIVKPSSTVQTAQRHLVNLRSRTITPSLNIAHNSSKDLPPTYAEIFQVNKEVVSGDNQRGSTSSLNVDSNVFFTKINTDNRLQSPPPAYQSNINIV